MTNVSALPPGTDSGNPIAPRRPAGGIRAAALALAFLTGCAVVEAPEEPPEPVSDGALRLSLAQGYRDHAAYLGGMAGQWRGARLFAEKGLDIARGAAIAPEVPTRWLLSFDDVQELSLARASLLAILASAEVLDSAEVAAAVVAYDCWVEEAARLADPALAAPCRDRYYALTSLIAGGQQTRGTLARSYYVFFGGAETGLGEGGRQLLSLLGGRLAGDEGLTITLSATLPEGEEAALTRGRVDAVADALRAFGVDQHRIQRTAGARTLETFGPDFAATAVRRVEVRLERSLNAVSAPPAQQ